MRRIRTAMAAALLASFVGVQPVPAAAGDDDRRDRREDRWDRRDDRGRRPDWREQRRGRDPVRYERRDGSWDPARSYRNDAHRYRARRLGRNDRIYRGSDNRYYCRRDDGTTGLIVGGVACGVLGNFIAPGSSKTIGTLIGAGAGALIGRAIDDGDVVCR